MTGRPGGESRSPSRVAPTASALAAVDAWEAETKKAHADAETWRGYADAEIEAKLAKIGVSFLTIPAPTGEELHRLEGWRDNIEQYGQDLWAIYHWIVKAQDGHTHGVYALAQWLEYWHVPDNTTKSGDYEEVFRARRS